MASFTPTSSDTLADQDLYLNGGLVEVACLDCLATVRVRKNSRAHTSIQWDADAVAHCSEFARLTSDGERSVMRSCPRLKDSIDAAVKGGSLHVGDEEE